MESGAQTEVVHRHRVVVQGRDDVRAVILERVALALDAVRREHDELPAVLLQHVSPARELRDFVLPHGRVHDLHRGIDRNQRNRILAEQILGGALRIPILENRGKGLSLVVSEFVHVLERRLEALRRPRQRPPDERRAANPQLSRLRERRGRKGCGAKTGEQGLRESAAIERVRHAWVTRFLSSRSGGGFLRGDLAD
jgi:hypothetical protein